MIITSLNNKNNFFMQNNLLLIKTRARQYHPVLMQELMDDMITHNLVSFGFIGMIVSKVYKF